MKEMTIREVQQILLDILKDVHEFCVNNNIRYSLSGGTLLGAIRHNGFIPWDDDADIQIPRPDYERFIRTYKSKIGCQLFCRELEGGENVKLRFARICEMEKTIVKKDRVPWINIDTGIGLDVLPVEGAPSSEKEMRRYLRKRIILNMICSIWRVKGSSFTSVKECPSLKSKVIFITKKLLSYFVGDWIMDLYIKEQKRYDYETSEYFCASTHYGMGEWQPKRNMESFILHQFEDTELNIMSGYDDNLKSLYGDYMKIPPIGKRTVHIGYVNFWR